MATFNVATLNEKRPHAHQQSNNTVVFFTKSSLFQVHSVAKLVYFKVFLPRGWVDFNIFAIFFTNNFLTILFLIVSFFRQLQSHRKNFSSNLFVPTQLLLNTFGNIYYHKKHSLLKTKLDSSNQNFQSTFLLTFVIFYFNIFFVDLVFHYFHVVQPSAARLVKFYTKLNTILFQQGKISQLIINDIHYRNRFHDQKYLYHLELEP